MFSNHCFPFPEFQVGCVAFDGTIYYFFIFDTVYIPKPCQRFLKDRFVCFFYSQNAEIALSQSKVAEFYRDNLKGF